MKLQEVTIKLSLYLVVGLAAVPVVSLIYELVSNT